MTTDSERAEKLEKAIQEALRLLVTPGVDPLDEVWNHLTNSLREASTPEAPSRRARREQREEQLRTIGSRCEILWDSAIHWPPKYLHAIEACLDADAEFDRASLRRSIEED